MRPDMPTFPLHAAHAPVPRMVRWGRSLLLLVLLSPLVVLAGHAGSTQSAEASDDNERGDSALTFHVVLPSGDPALVMSMEVTVVCADGTQCTAPVDVKHGLAWVMPASAELWKRLHTPGAQIWLSARSYPSLRKPYAIVSGPYASLPVKLQLKEAAVVDLHLVDERGRSLPGSLVTVRPVAKDRDVRLETSGIGPVSEGDFQLILAPTTEHVVTFSVPHGFAPLDPVILRPPFPKTLTLTLKHQARPQVRVLDGEGRPVVGATIALLGPVIGNVGASSPPRPPPPVLIRALTDSEGQADFLLATARKTAQIAITPPASRPHLAAGTWAPWKGDEPLVAELKPARSIRGVVRDQRGAPIPAATVLYRTGPADAWRRVVASEAGQYIIPHVTSATVQAAPEAQGLLRTYDWWKDAHSRTRIEAGRQDADLTLDLGLAVGLRVADPARVMKQLGFPAFMLRSFSLTLVALDASGRQARATLAPDGAVRFYGLVDGESYAVWSTFGGTGTYVFRRDIQARSKPYVLHSTEGTPLEVRLKQDAHASKLTDLSGKASVAPGAYAVGGRVAGAPDTLRFRGLPTTVVHVHVDASDVGPDGARRSWVADRDVDLSKTKRVDLTLRRRAAVPPPGGKK